MIGAIFYYPKKCFPEKNEIIVKSIYVLRYDLIKIKKSPRRIVHRSRFNTGNDMLRYAVRKIARTARGKPVPFV